MNITLLASTPNPERVIATAARTCYSKDVPDTIYESLTEEKISSLLRKLVELKHYSVFEHVSYTFSISGISRSCTHQLVRHRIASYSQQSQRYVDLTDSTSAIIPSSIFDSDETNEKYTNCIKEIYSTYAELVNSGIPKEDARYILPNSSTSNIIVTMNARELFNFFKLRTCNRAQWEIRTIAWKMLNICKELNPSIFEFAGPACLYGSCDQGRMSCNTPYNSF